MVHSPKPPSERSFGFVFTVFFLVLGLWPLLSGAPPRIALLIAAGVIAAIAVLAPKVLAPLNLVWFKFGLALGKVVSPIVLGLLFFVIVTPIGLVARASGKNLLRRRKPEGQSYWQAREPAGPKPGSMRDQF